MDKSVKKYGVIYRITNKISGKSYIGQTIRSINSRWVQHCSNARLKKTAIGCAIQKYGRDNFETQEVATAFNKVDLDHLEMLFIKQEATLSPFGYNLDLGGNGPNRCSTETRLKMRLARLGKAPAMKGKHYNRKIFQPKGIKRGKYSAEHCKKISLGNMGKVLSPEAIEKMRLSKTGVPATWNHCPIVATNIQTLEQRNFRYTGEAAKELGCLRQSISNILIGKAKVTRNNWTFRYANEEDGSK